MSYELTLKRGTVLLLLAGVGSIGILLFVAGLAVGVDAGARRSAGAVALAAPCPAEAAPAASPPEAESAPTALGPAPAPPPHTGGPGDEEGAFSLQVGEFRSEERALALLERLGERGYAPFVVSGLDRRGRPFFHVRVEEHGGAEGARRAAAAFTAREGLPAWVVPTEQGLP